MEPKVILHKSLPPVASLSNINLVYTLLPYFYDSFYCYPPIYT
jgi:hypothetical protein